MKKINYFVSIIALICMMTCLLSACGKSKNAERTIVVLIDPITGEEFEENKDFTVKNYPAEQLQGKKIQYKLKIKNTGKEITNYDMKKAGLGTIEDYIHIISQDSETSEYIKDTDYWPTKPGRYFLEVEFDPLKSGLPGKDIKYGGSTCYLSYDIK